MGDAFRWFSPSFSRHGKIQASLFLLIWLNENVVNVLPLITALIIFNLRNAACRSASTSCVPFLFMSVS